MVPGFCVLLLVRLTWRVLGFDVFAAGAADLAGHQGILLLLVRLTWRVSGIWGLAAGAAG